jgi:hypothetical protein
MKIYIAAIIILAVGCKSNDAMKNFAPQYTPGPQALVYKTLKDYSNHVPVLLSDDKSEIASYPAPKDVMSGSNYLTPTRLKKEYLLDNRGIGKNVAFLKYTYAEYAQLEKAPSLQSLYDAIIDKNPLLELCDCGNKTGFSDIESQLNYLIDKKSLREICKIIK